MALAPCARLGVAAGKGRRVDLEQAVLSLAIGVSGSLIASLLFVTSMRRIRPRVRIAPTLQLNPNRDKARVDVENRSRATLRDVEVALFVGYPDHTEPGRKLGGSPRGARFASWGISGGRGTGRPRSTST